MLITICFNFLHRTHSLGARTDDDDMCVKWNEIKFLTHLLGVGVAAFAAAVVL
jgi:hypothetical protein